MKGKVIGSVVLVLGVLIALAPRYLLPVCEWAGKRSGMLCGYSGRAEIFLGIIIISIGIVVLLAKSMEVIKLIMLVAFVTGVSVIAVPEVIGYCPSSQMPCHYGTVPLLRLLGGLAVITALVAAFILRGSAKES